MPVPISELFITVGADVSGATSALGGLSSQVQKIGNNLQSTGRDLSLGITAPLAAIGGVVTNVGSGFEHAFTQVKKTVNNLSSDELDQLRTQLLDLSESPLGGGKTADELANIAATAGQLGIEGVPALASFTQTAAGLSVTTGIAVGTIADNLGRIGKLTHEATPEGFQKLGSVITALGNEMGGTESDILDLANRLSGALTTAGATAPQILGIASALAELGVNAEAGGTAVSRFFLDMITAASGSGQVTEKQAQQMQSLQDRITDLGSQLQTAQARMQSFGRNTPSAQIQSTTDDIERYKREIGQAQAQLQTLQNAAGGGQITAFANVAGVTADEFKNLVKNDPTGAFKAIVSGLARIKQEKGPEGVVKALADLGINEERMTQTLLKLSEGQDSLNKGLNVANDQWSENSALQEEVRKSMEDTQNQFALLQNRLKRIAIDAWPSFQKAAAEAMGVITSQVIPRLRELLGWWNGLEPAMQQNIIKFGALAAAIGPAVFLLGVIITTLGALVSPLVLAAGLVAVVAAAWIGNWGDIRDKAGAAIQKVSDLLNSDLSGALRVIAVLSVVAATIIAAQLAIMTVAWAKAGVQATIAAIKIGAAWLIAAAPAIGVAALIVGAIVAIIAIVAFFRKAWDENFLGMQQPIANLVNTIGDLFDLMSKLPAGFTPGMSPEDWKAQADAAHEFFSRVQQGQSAIPQLQGVADALDAGDAALQSFNAGFPDLQRQIQGAFNTGLTDVSPALAGAGVPQSSLNAAMQTAMGPGTVAGQAQGNAPVTVTINNPTVLDDSMLAQMNGQISDAILNALISAERATVPLPQPSLVPGQPF